ncbi:GT4 family glycosyltransferase PelF [Aquibacillus albus]|uniref:Glycosyltransferase involved in cell wall biosynthesis n=1 Tax=Aquibacillus albus TaxID=1168171 RepID=A0ABS2MW31_9BACI|nr:GT4 family glycosyltransferase PelF [Aquibacillus albus]MBM7570003.1 glycosyltransferase involved in cell wall biosynthesis [Aquibacillus albus]
MKICVIVEGSYPYVTGGVSSWVQMLIESLPQFEFSVYAISADHKQRGQFKYHIPENVVHMEEIFLDSYLDYQMKWGRRYRISTKEKEAIKSILVSKTPDWDTVFALFISGRIDHVINFLTSKDFFDIISELALEKYPNLPFTELYWSLRSMVLPLFLCIEHPIPKADLYHSMSTGYGGVVGGLASYMYKKPYMLTEHGIYTREREEEIIKATWIQGHLKDLWIRYFYSMSNCAYRYASNVIAMFERNQEIQVEIGCPKEKTTIIPNGVHVEDYEDLPILHQEEGMIHIGAIIRVVPIKDIKTMLQSFAIVKEQVPNAKFFVMGPTNEEPEYYEECVRFVERQGLEDVIFTGSINIKEYMKSIDILVLTSISEGQPFAILEGLAAGIPSVTTDVGSCREMIEGTNDSFGPAGFVAPVMSYSVIADGIITLCRDQKLREEMGRSGWKRVKAFYSKDGFIEQYKNIYEAQGRVQWQE